MEIGQEEVGEAIVITPVGHLDSKTSPEFEALLVDLWSQGRKRYLIEFSAVETISSAALRVLLMFTRKLRTRGGSLALSALNSHVRQVFDISGFSASFQISASRRAALESLSSEDHRTLETARLAAKILGLPSSALAGRGRRHGSGPASPTGAVALQLLRQTDAEATSRRDASSSPPGEVVDSSTDDPALGVSGGVGATSAPGESTDPGVWGRLRRHLGSRRR